MTNQGPKPALLGIDNGTQGLTALLVDYHTLEVIATGEGSYDFVPNLPTGCYEHEAKDWEDALKVAIQQVLPYLANDGNANNTVGYELKAIGISGQMHGQVMVKESASAAAAAAATTTTDTTEHDQRSGEVLGTVRLWCDARNQEEADELSEVFRNSVNSSSSTNTSDHHVNTNSSNIPKRCTVARWLWSIRNQADLASQCTFMTTPAGWLSYKLTNCKSLGIGDASGMFPVDSNTKQYHPTWLRIFDETYSTKQKESNVNIPLLSSILPRVVPCGQDAGYVTTEAVTWLGLPTSAIGIPVAPAEGDQPAALAGSLIGRPGMVSCSFGTSVCANLVGQAVKPTTTLGSVPSSPSTSDPDDLKSVDHFCNPDGEPIYMVWLRNGTTFLNSMVQMTAQQQQNGPMSGTDPSSSSSHAGADANEATSTRADFESAMKEVIMAPADCGGLLALPFLDDEPGLNVSKGGTAMIVGFSNRQGDDGTSTSNNTVGNVCKAALLSTMFNLKHGLDQLKQHYEKKKERQEQNDDDHGSSSSSTTTTIQTTEIILTGGLTKTPQCGQILSDVFNLPVKLLPGAEEGCSWGAAVLAKYRHYCLTTALSDGEAPASASNEETVQQMSWVEFLDSIPAKTQMSFTPNVEQVIQYQNVYVRYQKLLQLQSQLQQIVS